MRARLPRAADLTLPAGPPDPRLPTVAELPFARLKIAKAGKLVYDETFNGPLGTITEDSYYRYYSQTKIIATVATLLAAERGAHLPHLVGCFWMVYRVFLTTNVVYGAGLLRLDDRCEMYM